MTPVGKPAPSPRRRIGAHHGCEHPRRHVRGPVPDDRRGRGQDARLEDDRLPARPRRRAARRPRRPLVPGHRGRRQRVPAQELLQRRLIAARAPPIHWSDAIPRCPHPASRVVRVRPTSVGRKERSDPRGFCHQEAAQAHGQEEAPQAAQEDARPAPQARQVDHRLDGMGRVVLVTGISRDIGRRFARAAAGDPSIDRVIGVDVVPPRGDIGDVSFVRADIRNPVIAKVLAKEDVDTVVHMSVIATPGSRRRSRDDEGAQRHRLHAAARCVPEVADASSAWS